MALPTEIDFALIKRGDGADPEVFVVLCGLTDVTYNESVQKSDRYVRDCAKPGEVPLRRNKVTGKSLDIGGSGLTNAANIPTLNTAMGRIENYRVELYADNGTDTGNLLGTVAGAFLLASNSMNLTRDGDGTSDISLASDGAYTYTAAGA